MSYFHWSLIPNLGVIYYLFLIITGLTVIGYVIDTIFRKFRNVEDGNSGPLTKCGINFLLRFYMAVYLEICIACFIQFQNIQVHEFKYMISSAN
jgi:dolichyl-phosphate-mannose--protein O-mannosyl transferase